MNTLCIVLPVATAIAEDSAQALRNEGDRLLDMGRAGQDGVLLALNRRKLSRRSVPQEKPDRSCRAGSKGSMTIRLAASRSPSPRIGDPGAVTANRVPSRPCRRRRMVERLQQCPPVALRKHRGLMLAQNPFGLPRGRRPDERRELDPRQVGGA